MLIVSKTNPTHTISNSPNIKLITDVTVRSTNVTLCFLRCLKWYGGRSMKPTPHSRYTTTEAFWCRFKNIKSDSDQKESNALILRRKPITYIHCVPLLTQDCKPTNQICLNVQFSMQRRQLHFNKTLVNIIK